MKFKDKNTINIVLESLFSTYSERVPDVKKITNAMVLKKIFKRFSPLPGIKSKRSRYFHVNSNPNNQTLKKALASLEMDLIEETYIKKKILPNL